MPGRWPDDLRLLAPGRHGPAWFFLHVRARERRGQEPLLHLRLFRDRVPDTDQGDISGLSRSVSNLGSSLGTALAGSILVVAAIPGGVP